MVGTEEDNNGKNKFPWTTCRLYKARKMEKTSRQTRWLQQIKNP